MKDQLKSLLNQDNIIKVYVIDDEFFTTKSASVEDFVGALIAIEQAERLDELTNFDEGVDFVENQPILNDYAREIWHKASPEKHTDYLRQVFEIAGIAGQATTINIEHPLRKIFEDNDLLDLLELFSPDEWVAKVDEIINSIPENRKVIALFDQDLSQAGGQFETVRGENLVSEIIHQGKHVKLLPGILSYTVTNTGLELTERSKIIQKVHLQPKDLFVLSKIRVDQMALFVDGIKKMLLNGPFEQLKETTTEVISESFAYTIKKLQELDTYDFDYTVLQSSMNEGVWEPETLLRIIEILFKDKTKHILLEKNYAPRLNKLLAIARPLSSVEIEIEDAPDPYTEKFVLRHQEIYSPGNLINGLGKPIENGDIFNVIEGKNKGVYILLGQECDLAIRSNGKRSAQIGHLLKVKECTASELEEIINKRSSGVDKKPYLFDFWRTKALLEYVENGTQKLGLIQLATASMVNLDVLDLCAFSENGEANISPQDELFLDRFSVGMQKRYGYVQNEFAKQKEKLAGYQEGMQTVNQAMRTEILSSLVPKLTHGELIGKKDTFQNGSFSFGIQRAQALRDPYAKNLLGKYTDYLARTAEQHDFAV